jgi:hypothetical protein
MSWSYALVIICFSAVLTVPTALQLEWDAPEIFDWQAEDAVFNNRSKAWRAVPPSDAENKEYSVMSEAVRALKEKSHQPHLVFIGDSLMRQQYFNLASWLMHGEARPSEPSRQPDKSYQDRWRLFFLFQNRQLQGDNVSEICHCGRNARPNATAVNWVEDRFVSLPRNGSSISYFGWFGSVSFNGYFNPSGERPTQASCRLIGKCSSPFRWTVKQPGWQDAVGVVHFLNSVVMKLQPKPTHVVFNSGKWGHLNSHGLRNLFAAGAKIQKSEGTRFMWKTVTHSRTDTKHAHQSVVNAEKKLAQEHGWDVLDAYSETKKYPGQGHNDLYKDDLHFEDKVTTHLNRIYVEALLGSLP